MKKGEEDRILAGGLWVFDNEIAKIQQMPNPGGVTEVYSDGGRLLGLGFYNGLSKIRIRLLSRERRPIDRAFFYERIRNADEARQKLGFRNSYRVVFAEADLLPALIVDRFGEYLCVQTLALGMDLWKPVIVEILAEMFSPKGIYERNDVPVREKEGLPLICGTLFGEVPETVEIVENGHPMRVDIKNGQKTGYFLDQSENRAAIRPYVKDAEVLDAFCHTGGFAVHAALFGAKSVVAADISQEAVAATGENASLNGISCVRGVCANVFDLLREYERERNFFDTVILDPPAFCKSAKALPGAYRGYKEINLRAMKILRPGGTLITFSCSQHMLIGYFLEMLADAAADSGRDVRIVEIRTQSRDHPALLSNPASFYLKCVIAQIF